LKSKLKRKNKYGILGLYERKKEKSICSCSVHSLKGKNNKKENKLYPVK
jgi:hypothetical protein